MKKYIFFAIFSLGSIFGFSQQLSTDSNGTGLSQTVEFSDITYENYNPYSSFSEKDDDFKKRKPGIAFLWSFLIPGGGQFYNGDYYKGGLMLGSSLFALALVLDGNDNPTNGYQPGLNIGVPVLVGIGLWSLIDAPISANKLNKANGLTINLEPSLQRRSNLLTNKSDLSFGSKLTISF